MRVTQNSNFIPFQSSLEDIQIRISKEQARLSSGKQILSISDAPKEIVDVKRLTESITRNEQYLNNINGALQEFYSTSEILDSTTQKFENIRSLALDATQAGNFGNLSIIGTSIKGLLDDLMKDANSDFNGKLLFAGTNTTQDPVNNMFRISNEPPSLTNPSGLKIVFSGNTKDREIIKDTNNKEAINTKADEVFGSGGTAVFQSVVDLYNVIMFKSDGTKRGQSDIFSTDDISKINACQKVITDNMLSIAEANGRIGSKINRFEAVTEQLKNENSRLSELRSKDEDTDVAQSSISLARENNALQYTLQVGSKLVQQTLFDFIK